LLTLGRYARVQLSEVWTRSGLDQARALDALPAIQATRANVEALAATGA
jgi:hypothetical protein